MGSILEDKTKFLNMGGVHLHDNTAKNEQKLQKRLLDLVNQNILARDVYDRVRPTGSQRPFRLLENTFSASSSIPGTLEN